MGQYPFNHGLFLSWSHFWELSTYSERLRNLINRLLLLERCGVDLWDPRNNQLLWPKQNLFFRRFRPRYVQPEALIILKSWDFLCLGEGRRLLDSAVLLVIVLIQMLGWRSDKIFFTMNGKVLRVNSHHHVSFVFLTVAVHNFFIYFI